MHEILNNNNGIQLNSKERSDNIILIYFEELEMGLPSKLSLTPLS